MTMNFIQKSQIFSINFFLLFKDSIHHSILHLAWFYLNYKVISAKLHIVYLSSTWDKISAFKNTIV